MEKGKISVLKKALNKDFKDFKAGRKFARKKSKKVFEYVWKNDKKILYKDFDEKLCGLQKNVQLACKKIDGIVIKPGEEFSFWNVVGNASMRKGYSEDLVFDNGNTQVDVGFGFFQIVDMIHWLVLHTELNVTEMHDYSVELLPDFVIGCLIRYKDFDYRFKNTTKYTIQLKVWVDEQFIYGEIRCNVPLNQKYKVIEEDVFYKKDDDGAVYRNSSFYRVISNKNTNEEIKRELICKNHYKVMYDYKVLK